MSEKYLGEEFDIHGGGLDLLFPHHECEIAQTCAAKGHPTVHYWMHNNMITIDGKKMGKSYGNFITLDEFFNGTHPKLTQPYSPMTIRFFILMAHYRSTVDFSNEALQSAEKGMKRMMEGYASISRMKSSPTSAETAATLKTVEELEEKMYEAMNDDLTTPIVISNLYELVSLINKVIDGHAKIDEAGIQKTQQVFKTFLIDILGMKDENAAGADSAKTEAYKGAVDLLLDVRAKAKASKDWATSDLIRNKMAELGFVVKDTKDGATWTL
jgi:cysteinyl-tRNA synthetase